MFGFFLPGWLYAIMPYFQLIVGLAGATFPETYGRISGIILIVCSLLIIKMRKDNC